MNSVFLRLFLFCIPCTFLNALTDLDDLAKEYVIETKKIEIPEYPHAFNPSIVRWNGRLFMSFRVIPNHICTYYSRIGIVEVDEDFNPIRKPQLLDTLNDHICKLFAAEDARLVTIGDQLWIVFCDRDGLFNKGANRIHIAQLELVDNLFYLKQKECLRTFEGASWWLRERNWVPYDYQGSLLLTYSINPHKILSPILGTGSCETMFTSSADIQWPWGELRGGTPALLEDKDYLSFFHSSTPIQSVQSNGQTTIHYFIGAYLFSSEPPFEVKKISIEPIIGKEFYSENTYKPYWGPVIAIFPCGFISNKDFVWLFYGRHDHESWVAKIDKKELLKTLIPIENHF